MVNPNFFGPEEWPEFLKYHIGTQNEKIYQSLGCLEGLDTLKAI